MSSITREQIENDPRFLKNQEQASFLQQNPKGFTAIWKIENSDEYAISYRNPDSETDQTSAFSLDTITRSGQSVKEWVDQMGEGLRAYTIKKILLSESSPLCQIEDVPNELVVMMSCLDGTNQPITREISIFQVMDWMDEFNKSATRYVPEIVIPFAQDMRTLYETPLFWNPEHLEQRSDEEIFAQLPSGRHRYFIRAGNVKPFCLVYESAEGLKTQEFSLTVNGEMEIDGQNFIFLSDYLKQLSYPEPFFNPDHNPPLTAKLLPSPLSSSDSPTSSAVPASSALSNFLARARRAIAEKMRDSKM